MTAVKTMMCVGAVVALLAPAALACAFHGYTPRPTLVDTLYDSEQIVLARPDPADPQRFKAIEALAGPLDAVRLPQTPDADLRASLQRMPEVSVLFARDGAYGPWVRHSLVGPQMREVLQTALSRQTGWQGEPGPERAQFFAGLLDHPDGALRELALLELDRVDYQTLRGLRIRGLARQVAALDEGDQKLRPIRILLTGLAGDGGRAPVLIKGVQEGLTGNRRYLGAYTTALIELEGAGAVSTLARSFLAADQLPTDRRELMIEAYAIQGLYGSRRVKREVTRSMTALLQIKPQLAGAVARQFSRHGNWGLADAVAQAQIAAPPASARDAVPITKYLAFAKR